MLRDGLLSSNPDPNPKGPIIGQLKSPITIKYSGSVWGCRLTRFAIPVFALLTTAPAVAQNVFPTPGGDTTTGIVMMCMTTDGAVPCQPVPATRHYPGCTAGTSSGVCLAANTAIQFLQIQNPGTNAGNIACAFGSPAIIGDKSSITLVPGQPASWGLMTGGIPSGQLNCIASAPSTPIYVEWN